MLDSIKVPCPHCNNWHHISVAFVQGQIKAMRIGKVGEVAQQLKEKRGPFYDRWLAAMEKRGEQMRCKTCRFFENTKHGGKFMGITCKDALYTGGEFACKYHDFIQEH